jgi:hypothetical protein
VLREMKKRDVVQDAAKQERSLEKAKTVTLYFNRTSVCSLLCKESVELRLCNRERK